MLRGGARQNGRVSPALLSFIFPNSLQEQMAIALSVVRIQIVSIPQSKTVTCPPPPLSGSFTLFLSHSLRHARSQDGCMVLRTYIHALPLPHQTMVKQANLFTFPP
ncbi:hypothetical protein TRVL_03880 [Trypanosoma vivax]|nr:hypothetical protein TRVL_03880 [Trypanosoma vivax]